MSSLSLSLQSSSQSLSYSSQSSLSLSLSQSSQSFSQSSLSQSSQSLSQSSQSLSQSSALVKSFSELVLSLETETKLLKCLLNLRDASLQERDGEKGIGQKGNERGEDVRQKLEKIEGYVENLERDLMNFEEFLDSELQIVNEIEDTNQKAQQQQQEIQNLTKNLPVFFQRENNILTEKTNTLTTGYSNTVGDTNIFIELQEFESIPKSTRGRLTLEQTIESLESIRRLLDKKSERIFSTQRVKSAAQITALEEYRSLLHEEHQNKLFLTEKEIRSSVLFEGGESTGRAILQTLRALHRIKLVRSNGESTYVLMTKGDR